MSYREENGQVCIAKSTTMYFTEDQRRLECKGRMLRLRNFWAWHPLGETDATICENHSALIWNTMRPRKSSFIAEKIKEAWEGEGAHV